MAREPQPYMQNRELSWLTFNERVLEEARDPSNPLAERLKFVSIFTSNLDEFFMIRVGSITDMALVKETHVDNKSGRTPEEILGADLYFIDRIGLRENLSPTRANGLLAMIKQMKLYALAFQNKKP